MVLRKCSFVSGTVNAIFTVGVNQFEAVQMSQMVEMSVFEIR